MLEVAAMFLNAFTTIQDNPTALLTLIALTAFVVVGLALVVTLYAVKEHRAQ